MTVLSVGIRWAIVTLGLLAVIACDDTKSPGVGGAGGMGGRGGGAAGANGGASGSGAAGAGGAAGQAGGHQAGQGGMGGQAAQGGMGGSVATWNPADCHVSPVGQPSDAVAAAQWSAAKAYCETLSRQGCLPVAGSAPMSCTKDAQVDECIQEVLWTHGAVPAPCEDAWRADIACGAAASFAAPICAEAHVLGFPYGPAATCAKENEALVACADSASPITTVHGTYTSCTYDKDAGANCRADCQTRGNSSSLTCYGAEGLPKQCVCSLNGRLAPEGGNIFVNSCAEAAQQAADGLCTSLLDCCFVYTDAGKDVCGCMDPKRYGYDSCQAMVTFAKGRVVDICPEFAPLGGCWPPNGCITP
jgi:hypothetical protein